MGVDSSGPRAPQSRGSSLNPADPAPPGGTIQPATVAAARVVPSVPTFAVDNGFWYSVTPSQEPIVGVGTMVRVPLGGRKVRGYVVEVGRREPGRLRPIASVSMEPRTFDEPLLRSLTWGPHYVAPVVLLSERSAPSRKTQFARQVEATVSAAPGLGKHPLTAWSPAAVCSDSPPVA